MTRVEKPWGYELHWAKTDRYVGKLIHVNAGHALSLQYHEIKDETIYLQSGKLLFEIQEDGHLVSYVSTAGGTLMQIASQDVEPNAEAALKLSEAAALTFRKP